MKDPSEVYCRVAGRLTLALDLIESHVRFVFVDQALRSTAPGKANQESRAIVIPAGPAPMMAISASNSLPGSKLSKLSICISTIRSALRFRICEIQSHSVDGDQ